jgi:indolepyruvate ferredoxin oxidoreductase
MSVLYRLRRLRGTRLDPFAWTSCRRLERELVPWYEEVVERLLLAMKAGADPATVRRIAAAPEEIRGFEHVKEASARQVRTRVQAELSTLGS